MVCWWWALYKLAASELSQSIHELELTLTRNHYLGSFWQVSNCWLYVYNIHTLHSSTCFYDFYDIQPWFSLPSDVFLKIFRHSFHANDSTHACRSTTSSPSKSFNDELLDATCNRGTCPGVVADAMAVTMEAASKKVTKSHSNRDNYYIPFFFWPNNFQPKPTSGGWISTSPMGAR
jgi:hypothetical protein